MQLPTDLAPAQRAEVESFLAGVTLVGEHPEHTGPEQQRPSERCSLCPRPGGPVTVFRLHTRGSAMVVAHLACRRRALRKRRLQNFQVVY